MHFWAETNFMLSQFKELPCFSLIVLNLSQPFDRDAVQERHLHLIRHFCFGWLADDKLETVATQTQWQCRGHSHTNQRKKTFRKKNKKNKKNLHIGNPWVPAQGRTLSLGLSAKVKMSDKVHPPWLSQLWIKSGNRPWFQRRQLCAASQSLWYWNLHPFF